MISCANDKAYHSIVEQSKQNKINASIEIIFLKFVFIDTIKMLISKI